MLAALWGCRLTCSTITMITWWCLGGKVLIQLKCWDISVWTNLFNLAWLKTQQQLVFPQTMSKLLRTGRVTTGATWWNHPELCCHFPPMQHTLVFVGCMRMLYWLYIDFLEAKTNCCLPLIKSKIGGEPDNLTVWMCQSSQQSQTHSCTKL